VGSFKTFQLAPEPVIVGVRDLRAVALVVGLIMTASVARSSATRRAGSVESESESEAIEC